MINIVLLSILVFLNIINTIANLCNMQHNRRREKRADEEMLQKLR